MADSSPHNQTHFSFSEFTSPIPPKPIINQGKSYSYSCFLFKYLFLALFVIVLPLFPSRAPDFVNQTILIKFWELLHLLFIGIAVAYGLFSRRNVEPDIEPHPSVVDTSAPCYVSKMFPVSIFDNGCENPCGFEEKGVMHCWNDQHFEGVPAIVCSNGSSTVCVSDEQCIPHLPISAGNFGDSVRYYDGTNVVQAWNSEYYHSEPVVVVAQPYYTIGDGECADVFGYKPLGLPVRSLRSDARELQLDSPKYTNEHESDSSSGSRGSSKNPDYRSRDEEFGNLDPSNLEQKINDADAAVSASPIPWHSRSRRMERKEKEKRGNVTRPSHFRPLSVDETKFEALSSRSLQSARSFSPRTSVYSSLNSISSDDMNFQEEEVMGQNRNSYVPVSEYMNFQEEDLVKKPTSYVPALENMNFQEEDLAKNKTSYVPASEDMNIQEEDLGKKMTSQRSSPRYGRMAAKGKSAAVSRPSHFRPMSVDETQFESLSSRSFQSMGSIPSWTSLCSSLDSVSSENMNMQKEDLVAKKSSHGSSSSSSSSSSSPSPLARRNGETSLQKFHVHGYSIGSLPQDDMKSNLKDDLKGLKGIGGEDPPDNKELGMHSLQSDSEKPASLTKAPSRGKSVRTRRASGLTSETMRTGEICGNQTDEKVEKKPDDVESALKGKDKMNSGGPDLLLKGISKKNMDAFCPKTEVTFSNHHKRDEQESSKDLSEEDSDIELENLKVISDEDGVSQCVHDSGLDSEVDKKASEFIAKFKAQIRLQKMGSIERSKGQKTFGNYIR